MDMTINKEIKAAAKKAKANQFMTVRVNLGNGKFEIRKMKKTPALLAAISC